MKMLTVTQYCKICNFFKKFCKRAPGHIQFCLIWAIPKYKKLIIIFYFGRLFFHKMEGGYPWFFENKKVLLYAVCVHSQTWRCFGIELTKIYLIGSNVPIFQNRQIVLNHSTLLYSIYADNCPDYARPDCPPGLADPPLLLLTPGPGD